MAEKFNLIIILLPCFKVCEVGNGIDNSYSSLNWQTEYRISSYEIDIHICIQTTKTKNIRVSSESEIDVQLCIQHHTHFECRAVGLTFSSAFKNIHLEYQPMGSTFNSAFSTTHTLNIEILDRHLARHSKMFILTIEVSGRYLAFHSTPYIL